MLQMPDLAKSIKSPVLDLTLYSESDWAEAKRREVVIRQLADSPTCPQHAVTAAADALDLSPRHVYTLIRTYRNSGELLTSLIPARSNGGRGKSRLPKEIDAHIQDAIETVYLNHQKASASAVIEEVRRRCHCANLKAPSGSTIRKRIKKVPIQEVVKRRQGAKAARAYKAVVGAFPEPEYPLAIVQIDHTPVDLIVVDEIDRQPIGRPYLTLAIDIYSRCITGFCLTLEAPSAVSVGLCLTHTVLDKDEWLAVRKIDESWPIWGKPECIHVDNGAEFYSTALLRGCEQHGIRIEYRPPGQPHYGGTVERVIGTFMQLVHNLPGTTFSNIEERGDYDAEHLAALTLAKLEHWLTLAIVKYYHNKIHSSLGVAPLSRYQTGCQRRTGILGQSYPRHLVQSRAFIIDFLPVVWRTLQRHGFMIDRIAYYSEALSPLIGEKDQGKFLIRRDPRDLSRVYVLDPQSQQYLEIPYRTLSRPSITLWEHRQALERLRERGLADIKEATIFQAVEEMRTIAQNAIKQTRKARRDRERLRSSMPTPKTGKTSPKPSVRTGKVERFEDIESW